MARPKTTKAEGDNDVDPMLDSLKKILKPSCVMAGTTLLDQPPEILSISPAFDLAIGGIHVGATVTLGGGPGVGKTTLALHIAKKWQQRRPDTKVVYLDVENRLRQREMAMEGLDPARFTIIKSSEDQFLSGQDFLQVMDEILSTMWHTLVIVDSFGMLSDMSEIENSTYTGLQPGGINRSVNSFVRKVNARVPIRHNMLVGINHIYAKIGAKAGQKQYAQSGSSKMNFGASLQLLSTYAERDKEQIGQISNWQCQEKNSICAPGSAFQSIIRYGVGIDEIAEWVQLAIDLAILKKQEKGGWIEADFLEKKIQGSEKAREFFATSPDQLQELITRVQKAFEGV
jgi:RecA/RadA recombinase